MPRNGSGVYSLAEPPFVAQTPISSSAVNSDFSDIGAALTASLARDGQGGMTAVLPLAAAGVTYVIDPDTGMKRSGPNEQTIFCGGIDVVKITTAGAFDGVTGASLGFVVGVPYQWIFSTAPTGCIFLYGQPCTSSYPIIRALLIADGSPFGNDGTDPLFPDYRGVTGVGKANMGGVDRANLTGGTVLGATLGGQTVTLDTTMIPPHNHTGSGTTGGESNNHTHAYSGNTGTESATHTHSGSGNTGGFSATHHHDYNVPAGTTSSTQSGGGAGLNNIWTGAPAPSGTTDASADHTHAYSFTTGTESSAHTHAYSGSTGNNNVTHTHNYSFTTNNTGGGAAHNNVQPSLVVNYIMRTA